MRASAVLVFVVAVVATPADAELSSASRFPAYPKFCPATVCYEKSLGLECLVRSQQNDSGFWGPTSSSISVSPLVVSAGQYVTITIRTPYKLCSQDKSMAHSSQAGLRVPSSASTLTLLAERAPPP